VKRSPTAIAAASKRFAEASPAVPRARSSPTSLGGPAKALSRFRRSRRCQDHLGAEPAPSTSPRLPERIDSRESSGLPAKSFAVVRLEVRKSYPLGINWASSLEVGFRSLSWLWVRHLCEGCPLCRNPSPDLLHALGISAGISSAIFHLFSPKPLIFSGERRPVFHWNSVS